MTIANATQQEFVNASDRRGPWMATFTGKRFHLIDPRPEEVCIEDIAHALACIPRFNGHTKGPWPYSVAQHSVWVAEDLPANVVLLALHGLLHDAHEAYTGDISTPMKTAIGASQLRDIQRLIQETIYRALRVPPPLLWMRLRVKDADLRALEFERAVAVEGNGALNLTPETAETLFLQAFEWMGGRVPR
jgi:hypothetical protein